MAEAPAAPHPAGRPLIRRPVRPSEEEDPGGLRRGDSRGQEPPLELRASARVPDGGPSENGVHQKLRGDSSPPPPPTRLLEKGVDCCLSGRHRGKDALRLWARRTGGSGYQGGASF